ncbi:Tn3 family transposase [Streptomyces sp. NPDC127033]|uniref:Tn3 family transposase n=1 Tax=Streptomyces sp. NPDC127033 TaxID=3347110 RepID=UPI00365BB05C
MKVTTRHGDPWITVPKLEPLAEPTGLQALKEEVIRRWGVLDLLDVLKNADFLTGFTDEFSSVAAYERIDRATLQRRLLLALFALGTNMGIRAIVATGEHGGTETALRHIRRHFITVDLDMDRRLELPLSDVVPGPRRAAEDAARPAGVS